MKEDESQLRDGQTTCVAVLLSLLVFSVSGNLNVLVRALLTGRYEGG